MPLTNVSTGENVPSDINVVIEMPADTRAERVAKRKRQQTSLLVTALLIAYVGLAGWLGWRDWRRFPITACQSCGYDLSVAAHEKCPECGRACA